MAISINGPIAKLVLSVSSTTVTATSAAFTIPLADNYTWYMSVTTAQTTNDTVFQTDTGGALALQAVVDPRFMKFKYTLSGTTAFNLYVIANQRGSLSGSD